MRVLLLICAVVAVAVAADEKAPECLGCNGKNSVEIIYVDRPNHPTVKEIGARLSLECGNGQFSLTISVNDKKPDGTVILPDSPDYLQRLDIGSAILPGNIEKPIPDNGKNVWTIQKPLSYLSLVPSGDPECYNGKQCEVQYTTRDGEPLIIKQYIRVKGSQALHFFGYIDVALSCRVAPEQPPVVELPPAYPLKPIHLEECQHFSHLLTISRMRDVNSYKATIQGNFPGAAGHLSWQLGKCILTPSDGGSPLILTTDNGNPIIQPLANVIATRVGRSPVYEIELTLTNWGHSSAVLTCQIVTCTLSDSAEMPMCPASGPLRSLASGTRGISAEWRSDMERAPGVSTSVVGGPLTLIDTRFYPGDPNYICNVPANGWPNPGAGYPN